MILVYENWLQLMQGASFASRLKDSRVVHFLAFLVEFIGEISHFFSSEQQPEKSEVPPLEKLELQIKVKALFIYMLYGLMHIFGQQESFEMNGLTD